MYTSVCLARLKFDYCILICSPLLTYLMHSAQTRCTDNMVQCKSWNWLWTTGTFVAVGFHTC